MTYVIVQDVKGPISHAKHRRILEEYPQARIVVAVMRTGATKVLKNSTNEHIQIRSGYYLTEEVS